MNRFSFYSRNTSKHGLYMISFLILVIAITFCDFTTVSNYIIYPIWFLWLPCVVSSSSTLWKDEKTFIRVSIVLLAIILGYAFIGYSSVQSGELLRNINWIMAGIVAINAMHLFSSREQSITYSVMTICLLLLSIIYINLGRAIIAIEDQSEAATVASAWYGSLFMLLTGLSLIVFLHVKRLLPRIITFLILILTLYLNVFVLQRGTNVLFSIAEIGLILVFLIKRKPVVIALSITIAGFVILAQSSDNMVLLFDWLAYISPSERLSVRFEDISTAVTYEDIQVTRGSLAGRSELIGVSWSTFTSSIGRFVFGAGEHTGINTIIGHHSFIVDTLARYGIIGGALIFLYFQKQYKIVMSAVDKKIDWPLYMQCTVVFIAYVLRNFYGILSYGLSNLFILFYFPLTIQLIKNYSYRINNK